MTNKFKRHTISRPVGHIMTGQFMKEQKTALQSFFIYTRNIIPRIEEQIESRILYNITEKMDNELEKRDLTYAYWQRQEHLRQIIERVELDSPPEE